MKTTLEEIQKSVFWNLSLDPQFENISISFSGGRTSAVMTKLLIDQYSKTHNIVVTFANTGWEHPATLDFVRDCDLYWEFNTVWLEPVYFPLGEGIGHKIVTYETASRNGEPFEAYIQKYGIPNATTPACSDKLKRHVMESYLRNEKSWFKNKTSLNYTTAIGIRADEVDRVGDEVGIWYPLVPRNITKPMVNAALSKIDWDLKLPNDAFGNCVGCWKKSDRKLYTLALTAPESFDFAKRMEDKYGDHRCDRKAAGPDGRRHFYRGHRDSTDIIREAHEKVFQLYTDKTQGTIWDDTLDLGGGCNESCEAY